MVPAVHFLGPRRAGIGGFLRAIANALGCLRNTCALTEYANIRFSPGRRRRSTTFDAVLFRWATAPQGNGAATSTSKPFTGSARSIHPGPGGCGDFTSAPVRPKRRPATGLSVLYAGQDDGPLPCRSTRAGSLTRSTRFSGTAIPTAPTPKSGANRSLPMSGAQMSPAPWAHPADFCVCCSLALAKIGDKDIGKWPATARLELTTGVRLVDDGTSLSARLARRHAHVFRPAKRPSEIETP